MRSLCSLVCKWNYEIGADGREIGWNEHFLRQIGLEDLASELSSASRLGKVAKRYINENLGCGFPVSFEFPPLPGKPSSVCLATEFA